jgi:hypothetical protein
MSKSRPHLLLESVSFLASPNSLKATTRSHDIETTLSHRFEIRHTRQEESYDDHEVAEKKDRSLEVVALSFTIHITEQEDAEDDCDHVPLREDQAERVVDQVCPSKPLSINGTK